MAVTTIHQHQRLPVIHTGAAHGLALPAAGVNQPAGGQLDVAVIERVMHYLGLAGDDVFALLGCDGGVLEEAAGIANDFRVRQLGAADFAHPFKNLLGRGLLNAFFGLLALQVQIAQIRRPGLGQGQAHLGDDGPALQTDAAWQTARHGQVLGLGRGVLEDRVAVAKRALGGVERKAFARGQIDGIERVKAILQLQPISADVLHRRGAHGAGNQPHVLQPGIALGQRPGHQVMPALARTGLHNPVLVGFMQQLHASNFDFQHHRRYIAGQHHVAATTEHKHGLMAPERVG